jgi:hypothetical protein
LEKELNSADSHLEKINKSALKGIKRCERKVMKAL